MIDKIWSLYLRVNYCGQKVTGPFFNERAIVNAVMFEFSFVTSCIPFLVISMIGIRNPFVGASVAFMYVLLLWRWGERRLWDKIDFEKLEEYYGSLAKWKRILCFPLALIIFILSFLFMLLTIKVVF